ncbi:MAG: hypothetical protein ACRC57_02855 [Sarcina sp.]
MNNKKIIASVNLIGFIFLMCASFIFAQKQGMFDTDKIRPVFMPASYAFSIWILIYILMFLWIIKGFFPTYKQFDMYKKSVVVFFICEILTGLTVIVPTKVSPIFIVGALVTSLITYNIVDKSDVSKMYKVPFSFLTAWLSVATIVDISQVFKIIGITKIGGLDEYAVAIIFLMIGTAIATMFTILKNDNIYSLVFIWGYIAIAIENKKSTSIVIMAIGACVIMIAGIIYNLFTKRKLK